MLYRRTQNGGQVGTYTTNPQVIHETIEGETIIIDLVSGTYFSLQGSGPEIWNALAAGEPADAIAARYGAQHADDVATFVRELEAEGLIAAVQGDAPAVVAQTSTNGHSHSFTAPSVEKYTDMQDIILLDPVHQVDARGWPHAQPGAA